MGPGRRAGSRIMAKERVRRQGKHYCEINHLAFRSQLNSRACGRTIDGLMDALEQNSTACPVAVVMACTPLVNNRWQNEQWAASEVLLDVAPAGAANLPMPATTDKRLIYRGLEVRLFRDEAEGYLYNIMSPEPKVFVLWRMHDDVPRPERVTVSY